MCFCSNKRQVPKTTKFKSQYTQPSNDKTFFSKLIEKPRSAQKHNKQQKESSLLSIYHNNNQHQSIAHSFNLFTVLNIIAQGALNMINIQSKFQMEFIYGTQLKIVRKGVIKTVMAFLDPNLPNMLWFTSFTKSYLFDLSFTSIDLCDYNVEKTINSRFYFILRYFEEEIPLVFETEDQKQKYYKLFKYYIIYNKERQYPPFFSKIMKLSLTQNYNQKLNNKKTVLNILNIASILKISNRQDNFELLHSLWRRQNQKNKVKVSRQFNEETPLKFDLIEQYFRIKHCLPNLIGVYEIYSGIKMQGQLDYLAKNMEKSSFINFLEVEQSATESQIAKATQQYQTQLNFFDFCVFLQNQKINYAILPQQIDEDLPLTDYFCYSSHNTYLSGNQLMSDCKIERYCQDLQNGLKCVQLDIHNDGDTPIINHAFKDKSLCKPIDFEETIIEIVKYCEMMPKHYPVILSFQNHAKEENRFKIINILLKHMTKKIFFFSEEYASQVPVLCKTLRQFIGKIIIKTDAKYKELQQFTRKNIFYLKNHEEQQKLKLNSEARFPSSDFQERFNKFSQTIQRYKSRRQQFKCSIPHSLFLPIQEMTKCTGMFKSQTGIDKQDSMGYQCTSLNNKKIEKDKDKLVNYTKRSFLRVYPVNTQILSNNYDPVPALKIGAQIIALNTQTKDDQVFMMMSYFKAGRPQNAEQIGYVQKPAYLRTCKYEPKPNIYKQITFKVITDYHRVKMKLFGTQRDMKLNEKLKQNSFSLYDYDQAFIMFEIDENFKQCIPVRFIRSGYRVLVAKNHYYKDSGSRVIVKISITNNNI